MPLSFTSRNHSNIAFGFFNIESDMLLLDNYFFFADDFCRWINKIIAMTDSNDSKKHKIKDTVYCIADAEKIGDLISDGRHTSYPVYRVYLRICFHKYKLYDTSA